MPVLRRLRKAIQKNYKGGQKSDTFLVLDHIEIKNASSKSDWKSLLKVWWPHSGKDPGWSQSRSLWVWSLRSPFQSSGNLAGCVPSSLFSKVFSSYRRVSLSQGCCGEEGENTLWILNIRLLGSGAFETLLSAILSVWFKETHKNSQEKDHWGHVRMCVKTFAKCKELHRC